MKQFQFISKVILVALLIFFMKETKAQSPVNLTNPLIVAGSDFGRVLQQLYKQGHFEIMLQLTANGSRKQFNDSVILAKYSSIDFAYEIKLRSANIERDTFTLNYSAKINATETIVRMKIVVEHDSTRIVLPFNFLNQKVFLIK